MDVHKCMYILNIWTIWIYWITIMYHSPKFCVVLLNGEDRESSVVTEIQCSLCLQICILLAFEWLYQSDSCWSTRNQESTKFLQDIYSYIRVVFQETEQQTIFYKQWYRNIHKAAFWLKIETFDLTQGSLNVT